MFSRSMRTVTADDMNMKGIWEVLQHSQIIYVRPLVHEAAYEVTAALQLSLWTASPLRLRV